MSLPRPRLATSAEATSAAKVRVWIMAAIQPSQLKLSCQRFQSRAHSLASSRVDLECRRGNTPVRLAAVVTGQAASPFGGVHRCDHGSLCWLSGLQYRPVQRSWRPRRDGPRRMRWRLACRRWRTATRSVRCWSPMRDPRQPGFRRVRAIVGERRGVPGRRRQQREGAGGDPRPAAGAAQKNASPTPGRDFHLVMNQTVDVTGDTATGYSRGTWVSTNTEKRLQVSIVANYYDQFVRKTGAGNSCVTRSVARRPRRADRASPWKRDDLPKSRSAAPGWQGAKSELIGHK